MLADRPEPPSEDSQIRIDRLERMLQTSRLLSSTLDLRQLLDLIIRTATDLIDAEASSLLLEDARTGQLFFAATTNQAPESLNHIIVPIDNSLAGTIYRTGEPLIVQNVENDNRHYEGVDQSLHFETRSLLGVPLQVRQKNIGVLETLNKRGNSGIFTAEDIQVQSTLASQAAIAIENARLVSQLRDANQRLAEIDRIKSEFISIASHELRTPLGLILGYASFLQEQVSSESEMSTEVEMVLYGATKLQRLIESMTNLHYLEAGAIQLDYQPVIFQELITEVCRDWQPLAAGKHQTLNLKMPVAPLHGRVDPVRVNAALSNLINNAIKFTPNGGIIEISLRPQTGSVAISVTDNGIGIAPQNLDRIFEPFVQVENHLTRSHEGMGLGLSVARGMIERHGGRIWAQSVLGHGSCFTISLPRAMETSPK